ncbi:hypothetical protein SPRG_15255 [Saprolegnia parasitica CBS 223.65]|uniref:Uncharacterized protein n=1 Tax=Saprolegnia parasitica (strain CBS 223.65) TaxID=695850 RepID=A0A067BYF6_SAPPC|nr:hypothetical protein SPRG_15255 [Saprolegnia parasitica CBS 223.65]KDO19597.1 hypothetical protein SPRG_15255 [Saprolegnia parasitica CBS 223.65]|eukprot:XP_012209693.1 hypothetical protein SPRG_15255 [Saprolegnia parasitica CBS 223.65]
MARTDAPREARWSVLRLMPMLYESIALGGRNGVSIRELFDMYEPTKDAAVRDACWSILRQGAFQDQPVRFYRIQPVSAAPIKYEAATSGSKRKAPPKPKAAPSKKRRKTSDNDHSASEYSGSASDIEVVASAPVKAPPNRRVPPPPVRQPPPFETLPAVDVRGLAFTDAYVDPSLVAIANEDLRLKALGISYAESDFNPVYVDILERVAITREKGLAITDLAGSLAQSDVKRVHHFLDGLIARNLVVKRIILVESRRFNMIHLTRFAALFRPSMLAPGATLEDELYNKGAMVTRMLQSLRAHKESTAVFADIAKRFNWSKRLQETIRNYIVQEMLRDAAYPVQVFTATCRSSRRSSGRKLWCVKVYEPPVDAPAKHRASHPPRCELGPLEHIYSLIADTPEGLTIPQVRDRCGMSDKVSYKKVQSLLLSYSLETEKLLVGRSTSYRFRVPSTLPLESKPAPDTVKADLRRPSLRSFVASSGQQPVANVIDVRTEFALSVVTEKQIVSLATFRRMLVLREHENGTAKTSKGFIDHRTITRIFQTLVKKKAVVFLDVLVPSSAPRHRRKVRCVALTSAVAAPGQPAIRHFIETFASNDVSDLAMLHNDDSMRIVVRDPLAAHKAPMTKTVVYKKSSHLSTERQSVILGQQNRRLGMAFGLACRTKLLHLAICEILMSLGLWDATTPSPITFSLLQVMSRIPLADFVHIFGCCERLTTAEETELHRVLRSESPAWRDLSESVLSKITKNKWRRIRRLMDHLRDLHVVVQEAATARASVVPAVFDDVDDMVLQAAEDTITGGRFVLHRAHMDVPVTHEAKKHDRVVLLDDASFLRPVTFFKFKRVDENHKLRVRHTFNSLDDVKAFWDIVECISIERTRFELVGENGFASPCFVAPAMFANASYVRHAWIDRVAPKKLLVPRTKPAATRQRRNERYSNHVASYVPKNSHRKRPVKVSAEPIRMKLKYPLMEATEEKALVLYFDELPSTWQIPVPVELRLPNEPKAVFRNPRLGRTKINYKAMCTKVGHARPMDLKRRIQSLMKDPVHKKRKRDMEAEMLSATNPSGLFLEEMTVHQSPRLYSCFVRAVQMMLEPNEVYNAKVADALFALWSTTELQMVWRYLWFSHMFVKATQKDLGHRRGFSLAPSTFDFLRLAPTLHPMPMCLEAADAAASLNGLDDVEADVPANTGAGHLAVLLSGAVTGAISLLPSFEAASDVELVEPPRKKGHAKYSDGFVGHLVRFTKGQSPDLFDDKWSVTSKSRSEHDVSDIVYGVEDDEMDMDDDDMDENDEMMAWECHCAVRHASLDACQTLFETKLLRLLTEAGPLGVASTYLFKQYRSQYSAPQLLSRLASLVAASKVLEAHSFAELRYVAASEAALWQLRPYALQDGTVRFDESQLPLASRPWLQLDGSVNTTCLLVLKREAAMLAWRFPGLSEAELQRQFRGLLGLQDTRCLAFMLIEDGVLSCRATKLSTSSLFSSSLPPAPVRGEYHMDRSEYVLRFFPTVSLVENLGSTMDDLFHN